MRSEGAIEIFTEAFGRPRRANRKVASWRLPAGIDIAIKRDERDAVSRELGVTIWLPARLSAALGSFDVRAYPAGASRSSALNALPALCAKADAIAVKVSTTAEAKTIVTLIRADLDSRE